MAFAAIMSGQDVALTARPDTSSILIGDQIHFRISAEVSSNASLILPVIHDTIAAKVLILGRPERDSVILQNGRKKITYDYLITSFEQGRYVIYPINGRVIENGITKDCHTDILTLEVVRPSVAPADTTDVIYDIVGPVNAPLTFREILPWIIIALVMILILWLLMRFLPRNPLRKLIKKEKPAETAHIVAFRELENLRKEELWQKGEVKEYYSRLTDILRRYVDGRFGIQSPELTTDETVRKLQKSGYVSNEILSVVRSILSDADMVKFAKFRPEEELNNSSIERAVHFVTVTRPVETAPENSASSEKKGDKDE